MLTPLGGAATTVPPTPRLVGPAPRIASVTASVAPSRRLLRVGGTLLGGLAQLYQCIQCQLNQLSATEPSASTPVPTSGTSLHQHQYLYHIGTPWICTNIRCHLCTTLVPVASVPTSWYPPTSVSNSAIVIPSKLL